ncbi:PREDICTED: protamine-2 [Ceratotherium simum simum]|uniref:Protamine-2 n=1 Tax=Ceratotherium simum simum TaxID=73337 RepID=A0ABM1DAP5_CERSS|nr:PREDICTED: protamine-2 [Ceratotherium simum simum]
MVRHRVRSPSERPQQGSGQQHGCEDQAQSPEDIQADGRAIGGRYRYRQRRGSPRRLYRLRTRRERSCGRRQRRACRHRRRRRGPPVPSAPHSGAPDTPATAQKGGGRLTRHWAPTHLTVPSPIHNQIP